MDLDQLRASHPRWTVDKTPDGRLHCQHGAWRFIAKNPDDAHAGIVRRETPVTVEELGRRISEAGF